MGVVEVLSMWWWRQVMVVVVMVLLMVVVVVVVVVVEEGGEHLPRDRLVSLRRQVVPHLLPPMEDTYNPDIDPEAHLETALIDAEPVKAGLKDCGRYSDKGGGLRGASRSSSPRNSPRNSWIGPAAVERRPSSVSVSSVTVDVDSCASSPGVMRRPPATDLSFADMRRALHEQPSPAEREQEERHRRAVAEKFQTASFAELCSITLANKPPESLYHCLNDIYGRGGYSEASASRKSSLSVDTTDLLSPQKVQKPIYEEYFPELFMY